MKKDLKKILYVEDEADIRVITKIALEDLGGFQLKLCGSGQEAIDTAAAFMPDLFILDVMMPDLDGIATLKALRKQSLFKKTPVIFMTARIQDSEMEEYRELGILDVITKPFDPLTLADKIREIWSKY